MWLSEESVGDAGASHLGYFSGRFSPDGTAIVANGYTGAFHMWARDTLDGGSGSSGTKTDSWQSTIGSDEGEKEHGLVSHSYGHCKWLCGTSCQIFWFTTILLMYLIRLCILRAAADVSAEAAQPGYLTWVPPDDLRCIYSIITTADLTSCGGDITLLRSISIASSAKPREVLTTTLA